MRLVIALLAILLGFFAGALRAEPSNLRETAIVSGDRVRLGDLFTNAGDYGDAVVAYAPEPGKRAVLDAQWLYRVARYYNLDWRPLGQKDKAVVIRESQVIGEEELADHVTAALIEKGADPDMQVTFAARGVRLHVGTAAAASVSVDYTSYDPRSRRFTAVVSAPANDPTAPRLPVSGKLFKMVEVPVLNRNRQADEVIRSSDIKWMKMPNDQVRRDMILDASGLVGMAPKRSLRSDQPITSNDIRKPVLVEKNDPVTMVLQTPTMTLTLKGKAMQDGSVGETVRVTNLQSKTVIEGVVTGPGTVLVQNLTRLSQMN
jgi:flagella basal body P-ring formation protein FlgA